MFSRIRSTFPQHTTSLLGHFKYISKLLMMHAPLLKPYQCCLNPTPTLSFIISFHVLVVLLNIPIYHAQIGNFQQYYSDCSNTSAVRCGNTTFKNPEYPFWGDTIRPIQCGLQGFKLRCQDNDLVVDIGSDTMYRVVETNPERSLLTLNYHDNPLENICASEEVTGRVLNETLYEYGYNTKDLNLFYNCDDEIVSPRIDPTFTCPSGNKTPVYFFLGNSFELVEEKIDSCTRTTLQVDMTVFEGVKNYSMQLDELFKKSFEVHYNTMNWKSCKDCRETGGWCWEGTYTTNNTCIYSNGTVLPPYPRPGGNGLFCLDGKVSPEIAEAAGFKEALSWCKKLSWENLLVELDCQQLVYAMRSSSETFCSS